MADYTKSQQEEARRAFGIPSHIWYGNMWQFRPEGRDPKAFEYVKAYKKAMKAMETSASNMLGTTSPMAGSLTTQTASAMGRLGLAGSGLANAIGSMSSGQMALAESRALSINSFMDNPQHLGKISPEYMPAGDKEWARFFGIGSIPKSGGLDRSLSIARAAVPPPPASNLRMGLLRGYDTTDPFGPEIATPPRYGPGGGGSLPGLMGPNPLRLS